MNHKQYQKNLKTKSIPELFYIIQDCKDAMEAMPDNPKNGYYADELNYCAMEINSRIKK